MTDADTLSSIFSTNFSRTCLQKSLDSCRWFIAM